MNTHDIVLKQPSNKLDVPWNLKFTWDEWIGVPERRDLLTKALGQPGVSAEKVPI